MPTDTKAFDRIRHLSYKPGAGSHFSMARSPRRCLLLPAGLVVRSERFPQGQDQGGTSASLPAPSPRMCPHSLEALAGAAGRKGASDPRATSQAAARRPSHPPPWLERQRRMEGRKCWPGRGGSGSGTLPAGGAPAATAEHCLAVPQAGTVATGRGEPTLTPEMAEDVVTQKLEMAEDVFTRKLARRSL